MKRNLLPIAAALLLTACQNDAPPTGPASQPKLERTSPRLTQVATSDRQWTGLAVAPDGRIFVCFPRWSDDVPISLGLLGKDGAVTPYPDETWNTWNTSLRPDSHFVCVQSATIGPDGGLWVLDAANPKFEGTVPEGPKLVKIDLATGKVDRNIVFGAAVAGPDSYLNDVRISHDGRHAYITDSGRGGLVVVLLSTGKSWRALDGHFSTLAEDYTPTIGGKPFTKKVNADGLALLASEGLLVYQALTGRHVFAAPTALLDDPKTTDAERIKHLQVRTVDSTGRQRWTRIGDQPLATLSEQGLAPVDVGASDGLLAVPGGMVLLTSLEFDAIRRLTPYAIETVVRDPRIAWPDSLAAGPDGAIYFTTSQIATDPADRGPYRLFRIAPKP